MPSMTMRGSLLLVLGAIAVGGITLVVRHAKAAAPAVIASAPAAQQASTPPNPNAPVIRFVKNPEPAPLLQEQDISGHAISAANWSGKVVLVNFWATWCPPCREEIPELIALQTKYKDRLQVVGISEDEDPPAKVLKFAQQKGMNYPIIMSTPKLLDSFGGVVALPTSFMIDTHGRVMQKHTGLYSLEVYDREVRALLGLPVDARIETFVDTGQVFLKNAANATELPGVDMKGLTAEQKKRVLHRLNAEDCTCGCGLTLAQCRINDSTCAISQGIAAQVVQEVKSGKSAPPAAPHPSVPNTM